MRDVELVLRYVAFERNYEAYTGNLKGFLDHIVVTYDQQWPHEKEGLDRILSTYERALRVTGLVFGKDAFKKWNGADFERRINRAVFDALARYFGSAEIEAVALNKKTEIVDAFKLLCVESDAFRAAIEQTTKTPFATKTRLKLWGEKLGEILGKHLDSEHMRLI